MNANKPFLKWAGGKQWLVQRLVGALPIYTRYIEPFLGGGSVFFATQPEAAILNDVNSELVNLYRVVRDFPEELQRLMAVHQENHSYKYYYDIRSCSLSDNVSAAARFLYLNRTCWNGLYRVNREGRFNVPKGTKESVLFGGENFFDYSRILARAEIWCKDFEGIIRSAGGNSLLFVDPPYVIDGVSHGFRRYNENCFTWDDQIRLRDVLLEAKGDGAKILLTNADYPDVRKLFGPYFDELRLARSSVLCGIGENRGSVTESLFVANLGEREAKHLKAQLGFERSGQPA